MVGLNLHFGSLIQCFKNSMGNTFEKPFIALSFIQHLFGSRYRHPQFHPPFPSSNHLANYWNRCYRRRCGGRGPRRFVRGRRWRCIRRVPRYHADIQIKFQQPKYMFISKKHHRIIRFQTASSIFRRESITAKTTIRSVSLR